VIALTDRISAVCASVIAFSIKRSVGNHSKPKLNSFNKSIISAYFFFTSFTATAQLGLKPMPTAFIPKVISSGHTCVVDTII
jgi:hypothetical protein